VKGFSRTLIAAGICMCSVGDRCPLWHEGTIGPPTRVSPACVQSFGSDEKEDGVLARSRGGNRLLNSDGRNCEKRNQRLASIWRVSGPQSGLADSMTRSGPQ